MTATKPTYLMYWFYYGSRPIDCVKVPIGTQGCEAKRLCLDSHDRVPLHAPDNATFRGELRHADLVIFDQYGQKFATPEGEHFDGTLEEAKEISRTMS
jgi:hypothetical protein